MNEMNEPLVYRGFTSGAIFLEKNAFFTRVDSFLWNI